MTDRRTHSLDILAAKVRNGKELDKARTRTVCRHNFCRCHRAGKRSKPQLPRSADHIYIHIRRDDKPRSGGSSLLHQLRRYYRTGSDHHPVLILFRDYRDRIRCCAERIGLLLVECDLHQAKTALIQCICYLKALFRRNAAYDGDQPILFNKTNGIFQHGFLLFQTARPYFSGGPHNGIFSLSCASAGHNSYLVSLLLRWPTGCIPHPPCRSARSPFSHQRPRQSSAQKSPRPPAPVSVRRR